MSSERNRPSHLSAHNAAAFQLAGVVDAYHLRTPYPQALGPFLSGLARPHGGVVLELGCGTGEIARMLAPHHARIDAVDISAAMLARASTMPGGDHPAIRWIRGAAEDVALDGPYALVVAGDSLHWMDWPVVFPRIRELLAPAAPLVLVSAQASPQLLDHLIEPIKRYSVIQDYAPFDLVAELEARELFRVSDSVTVGEEPFTRTLDEYIRSVHATSGFPRERMGDAPARAFDDEIRAILAPSAKDGVLHLTASARIAWGRPLS